MPNHRLTAVSGNPLQPAQEFTPAEPLWKRVPTRDTNGALLSDFMMLIPKLGQQPRAVLEEKIARLNAVLVSFQRRVVFADLNLKLNVLWVTVRPAPGICLDVATAIKMSIPEAVLVAHQQQH
jgi:hypothetical protein